MHRTRAFTTSIQEETASYKHIIVPLSEASFTNFTPPGEQTKPCISQYKLLCYIENTQCFALLPVPSPQHAHEKTATFFKTDKTHSADSYLHIPRFSCFYSSINQTFSTSHGVEKKFRGSQPRIETVCNKALCCRELQGRVGKTQLKCNVHSAGYRKTWCMSLKCFLKVSQCPHQHNLSSV